MLLIEIFRDEVVDKCQFGDIYLDSTQFCFSLENVDFLIPAGEYMGEIYDSPHNECEVILLRRVPDRTRIEIHPANWPFQLKGCIAPGMTKEKNGVGQSRVAFDAIMLRAKETDLIKVIVS